MIKELIFSKNCLKPKILYPISRQDREAALKATQMEDFGLQAILEKMNSLITPLISGPFWDISNIFQNFLIFSQSLSRQKIQLKVTLVVQNIWQRAICFSAGVGPNMAPRQNSDRPDDRRRRACRQRRRKKII